MVRALKYPLESVILHTQYDDIINNESCEVSFKMNLSHPSSHLLIVLLVGCSTALPFHISTFFYVKKKVSYVRRVEEPESLSSFFFCFFHDARVG